LREGLDLPEVSLVAVLDADKEGFLRSGGSLIQTVGRAARNVRGRAILYADRYTDSMNYAITETNRRRAKQVEYNEENGIQPASIIKPVDMELAGIAEADYVAIPESDGSEEDIAAGRLPEAIAALERQMREAAKQFAFEKAIQLRDRIRTLKEKQAGLQPVTNEKV
ncbi:MAG: UvrB/UvrC motif-containing protein, partial [Terriglobia bacterium]